MFTTEAFEIGACMSMHKHVIVDVLCYVVLEFHSGAVTAMHKLYWPKSVTAHCSWDDTTP